jgi:hypothetical protein
MAVTGGQILFQVDCNQMQQKPRLGGGSAAGATVSADFQSGYHDVEGAVALDLAFEAIEKSTLELGDLAAAQASHVDMIALRTTLVKMLFSLQVHEIEFVNQAVALEQMQGAIDGDAIDLRVDATGFAEDLAGVEMLFGGFDDAEDGAALAGHTQPARHQFCLKTARSFGFR